MRKKKKKKFVSLVVFYILVPLTRDVGLELRLHWKNRPVRIEFTIVVVPYSQIKDMLGEKKY